MSAWHGHFGCSRNRCRRRLLCDLGRLRFEPWSRRISRIKREICLLLQRIILESLQNKLFGYVFAFILRSCIRDAKSANGSEALAIVHNIVFVHIERRTIRTSPFKSILLLRRHALKSPAQTLQTSKTFSTKKIIFVFFKSSFFYSSTQKNV
jgi:hypothetical protein